MTTNRCSLLKTILLILAVIVFVQPPAVAQKGSSSSDTGDVSMPVAVDLNAIAAHSHNPITVRSRPVIERLPLQVIDPIDLQVSRAGNVFVADAAAGCIFRLDQLGSASLPARQLSGLCRIIVDANESVFALTTGSAQCSIHQVTPEGSRIVLHTLPMAAHCFSRAGVDGWMVATQRSVWHISADSAPQQIAQFAQRIVDLCTNAGGGTNVLLSDGQVLQLGLDGAARVAGRAPSTARRLICQPDGHLAVLAEAADIRASGTVALPRGLYPVFEPTVDSPPPAIARLPEGTSAVGFDVLGNLCLANPQLRAITRVTSRFQIPCPHCGQPIPLIFDASAKSENVGGF